MCRRNRKEDSQNITMVEIGCWEVWEKDTLTERRKNKKKRKSCRSLTLYKTVFLFLVTFDTSTQPELSDNQMRVWRFVIDWMIFTTPPHGPILMLIYFINNLTGSLCAKYSFDISFNWETEMQIFVLSCIQIIFIIHHSPNRIFGWYLHRWLKLE